VPGGEVELDQEHAGELGFPSPAGGCRRTRRRAVVTVAGGELGCRAIGSAVAAIAEVLTGGGEVELD
jgi:hypothetical protein